MARRIVARVTANWLGLDTSKAIDMGDGNLDFGEMTPQEEFGNPAFGVPNKPTTPTTTLPRPPGIPPNVGPGRPVAPLPPGFNPLARGPTPPLFPTAPLVNKPGGTVNLIDPNKPDGGASTVPRTNAQALYRALIHPMDRDPYSGPSAAMPQYLRDQYTRNSGGSEGGDGRETWSPPGAAVQDSQGRMVVLLNDDGSIDGNQIDFNDPGNTGAYWDPHLGLVAPFENTNQSAYDAVARRNRAIAALVIGGGALAGAGAAGAFGGAAESGFGGVVGGGSTTAAGPGTGLGFSATGSGGVGAGAAGTAATGGGSLLGTAGNVLRVGGGLYGLGNALSPGNNTVIVRGGSPKSGATPPLFDQQRPSTGIGSTVSGYAEGGAIKGPAGPRDNLLIRAEKDEYVIPRDVVLRKGTEFFDKIKEKVREDAGGSVEGGAPRAMGFRDGGPILGYADGGPVTGPVTDDPFYTLDASASPGLETLPPVNEAPPLFADGGGGAGMGADAGAALAPQPSIDGPIAASQAPSSGTLSLPAPRATRSESDREYIARLPTLEKIGLLLQSYQAGVEGKVNPFEAKLQLKQKREADARAELHSTLQTTKDAMEVVRTMPAGKARDAFIEQMKRSAGGQGDMVGAALEAVGTDEERQVRNIVSTIQNPAAQKMLIDACNGDSKCMRKMLADGDFMKSMERRADQVTLPAVTGKMAVLSRAMEKVDRLKGPDGKVSFTTADLIEENKKLPKEMQLTDGEMATAERNQSALIPYGLKTDKTLQAEQEAKAREGEHTPKMRTRIEGEKEIQEQWDSATKTWKEIGRGPRFARQVAPVVNVGDNSGALSPEAIKLLAKEAVKDPKALIGLGRGVQGAKDLRAVMNQMAEDAKASGTSVSDNRANYAADKKSLDKIVPQYDAITAFENNAIAQGKILIGLADKVDTTGIPVVERWIRAGRKNVAGDADVSEFNAQMQLYRAEAAKILTNPNLTGVLTDSARKEVKEFLGEDASPAQVKRVVNRLETDFGFRKKSFENQISDIKTRMAGGSKIASEATTAPAAAASMPLPMPKTKADAVKGQKYQTSRGVAMWDGEKFVPVQ